MSANKDFRSDLEQWMDIWDESGDEFQSEPAPAPEIPVADTSVLNLGDTPQDDYFGYMDSVEELLSEMKTPNPVYPDSAGKDSEDPDAAWVKEDLLKEIETLKNRLYKVENEFAKMGQGKQWSEKPVEDSGKKLLGEIESLRKKIDAVSDQLGIKDEPSPWETE